MSAECRVPVVHSRSASQVSSTSTFSSQGDTNEESPQTLTSAQIRRRCKVFGTPTRKAKRVRFFRNGDRHVFSNNAKVLLIMYIILKLLIFCLLQIFQGSCYASHSREIPVF